MKTFQKVLTLLLFLIIFSCSEPGIDGPTSLVKVSAESAGTNCAVGGTKIETGIDKNQDGALDNNEVQSTAYVCNGNPGANTLLKITSEASGSNCASGGYKIEAGVDTNKNGTLDAAEIQNTAYVCNGGAGLNSLLNVVSESAGDTCPSGGYKIQSGLDINKDGRLGNEEITQTQYICYETPGEIKDTEGNSYKIVKIGNQWWMAENLRATKYNDGSAISSISNNTAWANATTPAYCDYENNNTTRTPNGILYNWHVVNSPTNGGKNVCPAGWRVPTAADWFTLQNFVDPQVTMPAVGGIQGFDFGKKMKSKTGWQSDGNGIDQYGFNGLPTGYRLPDGTFSAAGFITYHWSVTRCTNCSPDPGGGFTSALYYMQDAAWNNPLQPNNGFCIRCVKN